MLSDLFVSKLRDYSEVLRSKGLIVNGISIDIFLDRCTGTSSLFCSFISDEKATVTQMVYAFAKTAEKRKKEAQAKKQIRP